MFTRNRFLSILKYLHFNDSSEETCTRLEKIGNIIDLLKEKFSNAVYPFQNLSIDESLMLWKGRLSFRQYIPSKRHRFGIKMFILCDCESKFVLDFIVYTDSETQIDREGDLGISGSIVMELLRKYLNKNHILFVDDGYSSPKLFGALLDNNTGACGTVKKNRKKCRYFEEK